MDIALDAMGGDEGPAVVVPAAVKALSLYPTLHLTLVGDRLHLDSFLSKCGDFPQDRLFIHHATETIGMDESPALALRNKKDSSMRVALNLLKEGEAQACVSAGNTGALLATARFVLKTLPGIDRPAIVRTLPTLNEPGQVRVLDLGANVDVSSEQLFQFAVMGSALVQAMDGVASPRVALLNIGQEAMKGNALVRETAERLSRAEDLNYTGFVEGHALYEGHVDVIACDGFVGNVALKVSEGTAKMVGTILREAFQSSWWSRIKGLIAQGVLKKAKQKVDPDRYNGASLMGVRGVVIKSHGGANVPAFVNAISEAVLAVERNAPAKIQATVEALLNKESNT